MPREGHDDVSRRHARQDEDFNPRAPRGARRILSAKLWPTNIFQSTCPARGTTIGPTDIFRLGIISIHVPREGHDPAPTLSGTSGRNFNPRAPRGARQHVIAAKCAYLRFQSTCPARGTTIKSYHARAYCCHFNPRAPRGARLHCRCQRSACSCISIHVPREGHDNNNIAGKVAAGDFNPRAPRGARLHTDKGTLSLAAYFNPRAPRGARQDGNQKMIEFVLFQSTCPARGTT